MASTVVRLFGIPLSTSFLVVVFYEGRNERISVLNSCITIYLEGLPFNLNMILLVYKCYG